MTLSLRRRPAPYDPIDQAERAAAVAELGRQRAAAVVADVDRARALAELARETAAADQEANRARRAAQEEDVRQRRAAELAAAELEREHRAARRQDRRERARQVAVRLRPVAPLLAVNGLALVGQVGYGVDNLSPGAPLAARFLVAVLFALALESIALYVGWHSHVALLAGASASAARLRVASYAVALVVAGINYSHFADGSGQPTAPAIAYGLVSLLSPWLWGLHSRRELHLSLERAGIVDHTGARFSAERWRAFPWRTRAARRWSIDHGVTDPRQAWSGYAAERAGRTPRRPARRPRPQSGPDTAPGAGWVAPPAGAVVLPMVPVDAPAPVAAPAVAPASVLVPEAASAPVSAAVDTGTDGETRAVLDRLQADWSADRDPAPSPVGVPELEPAPAGEPADRPAGGHPGTVPQFRAPEVLESDPAPVSQADSIRTALTATGGDVPAALALLSDQGIKVDSRYANRVARGMSPRVDTESDTATRTRTRSTKPAGIRRPAIERNAT